MKNRSTKKENLSLRKKAEAVLKKQASRVEELTKHDMKQLIHELGTHQIELEMQNEELRRAQEELEASRRKYADLYDFAPVGYFTLDTKGVIHEANMTGAELLGALARKKLVNVPFSRFINSEGVEELKRYRDHIAETLGARGKAVCELALRKKDGTLFFAHLQSIAVEETAGQPEHILTALIDITDRKQTEEELRRLSEQQDAIFKAIPYLISLHGRDGRWLKANPAVIEMFGCDPAKATREEIAASLRARLPDGTPLTPGNMPSSRALKGETVRGIEYIVTDRSGTDHVLEVNAVPLRADGEVYGLVLAQEDITDRKRAEDAQRESEEKLKLFIEHAPAALAMFDREMRYLSVSKRWLTDYGLGDRNIIGLSHYDVFPEIPERWKAVNRRGLAGEVVLMDEDRFERADGTTQWLRWEVRPWHDAMGQVGGIVIFTEDITNRVQAEKQLSYLASFPQLNPNPILETDMTGAVTFANPAAEHVLVQLGRERTDARAFVPEDLNGIIASWDRKSPLTVNREVMIANRVFNVTVHLTTDLATVRLYTYEITKRKQAEVALRESEERFRIIASSTPEHLLEQDGNLRYTLVINPQLGLAEKEMLGKTDEEILGRGDDATRLTAIKRKVLETGEAVHLEIPLLSRDGQQQFFEGSYIPKFDAQGRPDGLIGYFRNVTDRKLAEMALRKSEEQLQRLFEHMNSGLAHCRMFFDDNGRPEDFIYLAVNPAFARLTGLENVTGKRVTEAIPGIKQMHPELFDIYGRVARTGRPERFEIKFRLLDMWLDISVYSPQADHFVAIFDNITERKRVHEELQRSESKYRSLFDNMINGFAYHRIILDEEGRPIDYVFLEVNQTFERLVGLTAADVIGKRVTKVLPGIEKDPADWIGVYGRVALTGKAIQFEQHSVLLDKWLLVSAYAPERGHFATIFEDITARKFAEKALRESEARMAVFAAATFEGIVESEEGKIVDCNDQFARMVGSTVEELRGMFVGDLIPPGERQRVMENIWENRESVTEHLLLRGDGTSLIVEAHGRPAGPGSKRHTAVRDITERKKAEDALQRMNAELEQRVAERTEELRNLQAHIEAVREGERAYVAREVHDQLGQALTAFKMDLAWLNRVHPSADPAVQERRAEMLDLVDGAIQSVKRITSELRPAVLDDFGLQAAVEWAAREFEKRSGVTCRVSSRPATIAMDRTRATVIYRVLQESLTNIARHAGAKNVTISLTAEGERFHMSVQDDGKGIAAEKIDDPASFGLMGMRERLRFLGGELGIRGEPLEGTTVTASLPLRGVDTPVGGAQPAAPGDRPNSREEGDGKGESR